jgi:hypothetical protein
MLRRMFVTEREKVTGGWRKLYHEEHHNLYFSPNISVILYGLYAYAYRILVENLKGRYRFGDLGIDGRIILKWILKK